MTKEQFKERWESNDRGGGITFDDIAKCAIAWGGIPSPKTQPITQVRYRVLKIAGCVDAEYFKP